MEPIANLLARVRAGEANAAHELVDRFGPVVRSQVRVWLRRQDPRLRRLFDSMDVCQSAFASFFVGAAAGRYDLTDTPQVAALLLQMAKHKLLHQVRRHRAAQRDVRRVHGAEFDRTASRTPSPSATVAGQELLAEFRQRLTEEERQIAELREAGCSWKEVVETMGGAESARRMQLARALDRVAHELQFSDFATPGRGKQ